MKETLKKFHESILNKQTKEIKPLLKENPRISKERQMAVYIEGYRIRLANAVRLDHPASCFYLGDSKSKKLISDFVEAQPSQFYSLDFYPFGFAEYLKGKNLKPEALELAVLESNIQQVFFKPDSEQLQATHLTSMNEQQLEVFRFKPRVASSLLEFEYNVENFLQDYRSGKQPAKIDKKKAYIFIVRNNNEVKRHVLDATEFNVLKRLFSGLSAEQAIEGFEMAEQMLPQWLQKWLINGYFSE